MFRKPKRSNIRQRRQDHDSDEESQPNLNPQSEKAGDGVAGNDVPTSSSSQACEVKPLIPAAKLSFATDQEDEGIEFRVKKSGQSRRVAKQLQQERRKREDEMAEKEKQVQRMQLLNSALSVRKQMQQQEQVTSAVEQLSVDKKEEKKVEIIQIPEEDGMSDDDGEEEVLFRPTTSRSAIPDAETIFSLKKQRQKRRNQEEFISLVEETLPTNTADQRKEENDEDDEEFEDERIDFQVDKSQSDRDKAREAISSAQESDVRIDHDRNSDSDSGSSSSDGEMTKWESEQIAKGVGGVRVRPVVDSYHSQLMDVASPQLVPLVPIISNKIRIPDHLSRPCSHVSLDDVLIRLGQAAAEKQDKLKYLDNQLHHICEEEQSLSEQLHKFETLQQEYDSRRLQLVRQLQQELQEKEIV